jgi:hypothetical protein
MKKAILILIATFVVITGVRSQNVDDALRYSQTFYNGTARFISMGGAFTALGADLSTISLNPAGIGMYRSMEVSITPQLYYNNMSSVFNGTKSTDFKYNFGLSQAGVVTNLISNNNSTGLINLNVAYSYVSKNNYYENTTIKGVSDNSSMADYWTALANGSVSDNLSGGAALAYWTWLIDTIPGDPTMYGTIFSNYGENTNSVYGQTIRRIITNEGYSGEHAFSIAGNYSNNIFFGATLGLNRIRYIGHYEHLESDDQDLNPDFKDFSYVDHFEATGTGVSLKLGAILRPVEMLRIGFALHSPVIYRMHEYFYSGMVSDFDTPDVDGNYSYSENLDPLRYSYTLTTPFRALAGVSLQLKKLGILSADYEFVDYRMARFSNASDDYTYYDENQGIKNVLKSASNIRLGAEVHLNSIYLRAGYGLYGSAFNKDEVNKDLSYNTISCGLGFRQQNFFFDLAFANMSSKMKYYMYEDPPYLQPATLTSSRNTFTATLGFKF